MRGDSRRDLYSKALALCGLGVLAGAGALVDYWPVGVRFPAAHAPIGAREVTSVATLPAADDETFAQLTTLLNPPSLLRIAPVASASQEPAGPIVAPVAYQPLPVMAAGFDIGTPLDVELLPPPVFTMVRHEIPALPVAPVRLTAPASDRRLDPGHAAPAAADEGNLIASAFRKTGSSIVRGSVRTGSSLVDAVRVVGSAVRRALPD